MVLVQKHCEAMSSVQKRKYNNVIQGGGSYGRMAMWIHMDYEVMNMARWSSG